jgi:hypothetical protein
MEELARLLEKYGDQAVGAVKQGFPLVWAATYKAVLGAGYMRMYIGSFCSYWALPDVSILRRATLYLEER